MGALLSGRITYELMAGFWPTADADPSSTPPMVELADVSRDSEGKPPGWVTIFTRSVDEPPGRRNPRRRDPAEPVAGTNTQAACGRAGATRAFLPRRSVPSEAF